LGTSGWLCVTTDRVADLPANGVFSLPASAEGLYATVGEMETAGECLDWLAAILTAGEVTASEVTASEVTASEVTAGERERAAVADAVDAAAAAPPGCDGLTFAPWLFGERAPVNDASLRGTFLGLSLDHTRAHLCRAVLEGVAHNLRWLIDALGAKGLAEGRLRVIGGGVQSDLWMQIVADVTGRVVETVPKPQYAGARGAALLAMVGSGALGSVVDVAELTQPSAVFEPTSDPHVRADLDRAHRAFRSALPAARGHAKASARA
jgi:xylulokinase